MAGGAVFWAKEPSEIEIINDVNAWVINFYKQLKMNYPELRKLVEATLHSRDLYKEALVVYHAPYIFSELKRAWAFWVCTNQGFSKMVGSWGYDNSGKAEKSLMNSREGFVEEYSNRLALVKIENNDAVGKKKTEVLISNYPI